MKKVSPGQEAKTLSSLNYLRDDTVNSGGGGDTTGNKNPKSCSPF